MQVVVLAAGFATRLYPLTRDRAKPLLEVGGKCVLAWLLDSALAIPGVTRCVIVSNARFAADFESFAEDYESPVPLTVVDDGATAEHGKRGAVGDLALALEHTDSDGPLLVAAGDNLIDFALADFAELFGTAAGRPMLMVREVEGQVPPGTYSEVVLEPAAEGELESIASFREKPADPRSNLSAVGLYFLPSDVRANVRAYLDAGGEPDAPGHFFQWLCAERSVAAARLRGGWHDIGNHETLAQARAAFPEQ
ncbi:MAG: glucose-1-phosphate thymidylyltransferase [Planctomycetota bacterium]|jgi:glucose-1-phosphate thymidylyltransferase